MRLFLLFLLLPLTVFSSVTVECPRNQSCEFIKNRLELVVNESKTLNELKEGIRFIIKDNIIKTFSFRAIQKEGKISVSAKASLNQVIHDIVIEGAGDLNTDLLIDSLNIKVGQFLSDDDVQSSVSQMYQRLKISGYPNSKVVVSNKTINNKTIIRFVVELNQPVIINKIKSLTNRKKDLSFEQINQLEKQRFDLNIIKKSFNELEEEMRRKGFFNFKILPKYESLEKNKVQINYKIDWGTGYKFYIDGSKTLSREEILENLKSILAERNTRVNSDLIREIIQGLFSRVGMFNTKIKIYSLVGLDRLDNRIESFSIKIKEGGYSKVQEVLFEGNSKVTSDELLGVIKKKRMPFYERGEYRQDEFITFRDAIHNHIMNKGHVLSEVHGPFVENLTQNTIKVFYKIVEGSIVKVSKMTFGFPKNMIDDTKLQNQECQVFAPASLSVDSKEILNQLKAKGHYFAKVVGKNAPIKKFSSNFDTVSLNFAIDPGNKAIVEKFTVEGIKRTKRLVINRELTFKIGEFITPEAVQELNDRLVSLGLFSYLSINPKKIREESGLSYVDVILKVKERDYGLLKFSPGFRTDIGYKAEVDFRRLNIGGINESLSLNARLNRRTSFIQFDQGRPQSNVDLIEYSGAANYVIPFVWGDRIRVQLNGEATRRRFFGFDADIIRGSVQASKSLTKKVGASLKYQFETIQQFNASQELDEGYFRIGGVTATLFLDNRDKVINPTAGSYHGVSAELANPTLLSMDDDDLEVNFIKLSSRNRIYFTVDEVIFASSISMGWQKNLAKDYDDSSNRRGYIPRVKVFRLEGVDIVRGFEEIEINRLVEGIDISEKIIDDQVYFLNLKLEARRFLTPTLIGALFYDAGHISTETFTFNDLRHSVGTSLKFLTPVGTLNFDYGLKLSRKMIDGEKESFGRAHLAIGFF